MAEKWTKEEKLLLSSFIGFGLIDWGQTRDIAKRPEYYEKWNTILGSDPSIGQVDTYFPAALGLTVLAAHYGGKYRDDILKFASILELSAVANNYKIGLKIRY